MKHTQTFESFISEAKEVKEQFLNEGNSDYLFKPYHIKDAGIDKSSLPKKGESTFCVVRNDAVTIKGGSQVYLTNMIPGARYGGMRFEVVGLYDTEDEAMASFKAEVKKEVWGANMSVAMGKLTNRKAGASGLSFEEIEGYIASLI